MTALTKLRILIVEDHADTAATLSALLRCVGATVEVSETGRNGLALVEVFQPAAILLDLGLPDLNGFDVARCIRRGGHQPAIIAITGHAGQRYQDEARAAGIDYFLVKPCSFQQLRSVLAQPNVQRRRTAS